MSYVDIVSNDDDWEALFIDGFLADQDHSISMSALTAYLPIESITFHTLPEMAREALYRIGLFPDRITLGDALQLQDHV